MPVAQSSESRYGFAGHESFPFRYGWLEKAVAAVDRDERLFRSDRAIVELGVGKNMAASIRHWGLAAQVLETTAPGTLSVSSWGRLLLQHLDPFLEDPASLWLVHWRVVTNPMRAAAWYLAFNHFPRVEFSKDQLAEYLVSFVGRSGGRVTPTTLVRDVDCLVRMYVPAQGRPGLAEESFDCPLAELRLIRSLRNSEAYQFDVGPKRTLPPAILGVALIEYLEKTGNSRSTVPIQECVYGAGSPGQAFKLSEGAFMESLEGLSSLTDGGLEIDETAGLRQIYRRQGVSSLSLLRYHYGGRT
jgi:hypothetical protein